MNPKIFYILSTKTESYLEPSLRSQLGLFGTYYLSFFFSYVYMHVFPKKHY